MFQEGQGNFPKAMTMLEATAEANNRNAYDLALAAYKQAMLTLLGPSEAYMKESLALPQHQKALDSALELFGSIANMGSVRAIEGYKAKLGDEIEAEKKRFLEANALKVKLKWMWSQ